MTQPDAELAGKLAARLDRAAQTRLGRSLALYHAGLGGCGGCALELQMLRGTVYQMERLGLAFVPVPLHADVLLVTGPLTRALAEPLRRTWDAVPAPKWVVAIGDCACSGGPVAGSYATLGGVVEALPVDVAIHGCPPPPAEILRALTALVEANA